MANQPTPPPHNEPPPPPPKKFSRVKGLLNIGFP